VKRKDLIGQFDSDVVALMKKAGAIMLAITNVPELCMWWESLNNVYGRSRNPYDTNRTVGGSSGGEVNDVKNTNRRINLVRLHLFIRPVFLHLVVLPSESVILK
jgi:hypothetical protein